MTNAIVYAGLGDRWFGRTAMIRGTGGKPSAKPADSGGPAVDERGGAIGLVFAANSQFTYVCSLELVPRELGCRLPSINGLVGPDRGASLTTKQTAHEAWVLSPGSVTPDRPHRGRRQEYCRRGL